MRDNRSSLQACTPKARVATCRPTAKPEKSKFLFMGGGNRGGEGAEERPGGRSVARGAAGGEEGARSYTQRREAPARLRTGESCSFLPGTQLFFTVALY